MHGEERRAGLVIAACFIWLVVGQVTAIAALGNDLARNLDAFSEAGTLRAAESYVVRGFSRDAGLPHIHYGRQFPTQGAAPLHPEDPEGIYTHYPPGADLLAGAGTVFFGVGRVGVLRWIPVVFGLLSLAVLTASLWRRWRPYYAATVLLALASAPVVNRWLHSLYYQSYAMALMWLQLALLIQALRPRRSWQWSTSLGLAALGFGQGCLSFDYFFLTSLAGWPCWLLLTESERQARRLDLVRATVWPAIGFACAHGLHLVQVAVYLGGIGPAIHDLFHAAAVRVDTPVSAWRIALGYVKGLLVGPDLFGYRFTLLAFLTGLVLLWRLILSRRRAGLPPDWSGVGTRVIPPIAALIVCLLWTVSMRQHAMIHYFFLNCHFLLVYQILVMVAVSELWPAIGKEPE